MVVRRTYIPHAFLFDVYQPVKIMLVLLHQYKLEILIEFFPLVATISRGYNNTLILKGCNNNPFCTA